MKNFYLYITYTEENQFVNLGVTVDLQRRIDFLHKKYKCKKIKLVYFEVFDTSEEAIKREKELLEVYPSLIKELIINNNPMLINLTTNINLNK